MELSLRVKLALYEHFAAFGQRPSARAIASDLHVTPEAVREAFAQLRSQRVLVLEDEGESILMAPPFSGIPTQHRVVSDGVSYVANCAWDALAIPAALRKPGTVYSRCEQSLEPLALNVSNEGPGPSDWLFHCLVPAADWWKDIVFT